MVLSAASVALINASATGYCVLVLSSSTDSDSHHYCCSAVGLCLAVCNVLLLLVDRCLVVSVLVVVLVDCGGGIGCGAGRGRLVVRVVLLRRDGVALIAAMASAGGGSARGLLLDLCSPGCIRGVVLMAACAWCC